MLEADAQPKPPKPYASRPHRDSGRGVAEEDCMMRVARKVPPLRELVASRADPDKEPALHETREQNREDE